MHESIWVQVNLKSYNALEISHSYAYFKKGDKSDVCNYRPISLISIVGKAFERIVFRHVQNYLLSNALIYNISPAFWPVTRQFII